MLLKGMQMMGSQSYGSNNGKQSQFQPLAPHNSMYSLTLDEVQNQLGDLGKPLSSMNLDEFLKNVWTAEANQSTCVEMEGTTAGLSLTSALSKRTVDEVWRDIQQSKNNGEKKIPERKPTLGEMTLEDFLVKAGVVVEAFSDKKCDGPVLGLGQNAAPQFPQQGPWMQYPHPQYQHSQQNMMGVYVPGLPIPQPMNMVTGAVMDVSLPENQVGLTSPSMGTLSDPQTIVRKRGTPEDIIEKTVERRQKRMIKNRESAARSRARKQAYTNELEYKVSRLEEENERLRKLKELDIMFSAQPAQPKYQLRRTRSSLF